MAIPFRKIYREPQTALFYLYFYLRYWGILLRGGRRYIRFTGDRHSRAHLSWKVCRLLGLTESRERGMIAYHHVDKTWCQPAPFPAINGGCADISKSTVGHEFEVVFGYPISVQDPRTFEGPMVEKSEVNARHDGVVVSGPISQPREGVCYQRVIDNGTPDGFLVDLRTSVVGEEVVAVVERIRPNEAGARFRAEKTIRSVLREPGEVFSSDEQRKLLALCRRMNLDFGELDVLRDQEDGLIYVVDVAKTPTASHRTATNRVGIDLMRRVADAFERQFCRGTTLPTVNRIGRRRHWQEGKVRSDPKRQCHGTLRPKGHFPYSNKPLERKYAMTSSGLIASS